MAVTLVKISSINNRLIPLGLACLQAYLKAHDIDVRVHNFRSTDYELPKVFNDPLIQLTPPKFIMNHQDFPLLLTLITHARETKDVTFSHSVFHDIFQDYSARLFESYDITKSRYFLMVKYIKQKVLPKLLNCGEKLAFSVDYQNIIETAIASLLLKQHEPDVKIIWGGPTITQSSEAYKLLLKRKIFDGMVIGEGEVPLLEFAMGKELKQIRGMVSLSNNDHFIYQKGLQVDLNDLPTPDYENLSLDTYYQIASAYRSRGCTHRCQFCAEWNLFGPKFRVRSIKNIINDIEAIIKNVGPEYMIFGESLINDDRDYFSKLCSEMATRNLDMSFGAHFRADINEQLARKARKAGFDDAWVGLEAFTEEELLKMNKGLNVNDNVNAIENLTHADVNVLAMLVVGFSTMEDEVKNCDAILTLIDTLSKEKFCDTNGKKLPLSIQFRPAPMFLVPGSFDFNINVGKTTYPWKCSIASRENEKEIRNIEKELEQVPYEFDRPIPDRIVGKLMRKIQEADRYAGFRIGGIAHHAISFMMNQRKELRSKKRAQKVGIAAQRFGE